jgi:hypothetical protein
VYDTYWRFAAERQAIFQRRAAGQLGPWTDDAILRKYKFCNSFRASDRVSQYLIRDVIYGPEADGLAPEDVFLRVTLFRLFSKESTWEVLERTSGGLRRSTFDTAALAAALAAEKEHKAIYTAAFILCAANPYDRSAKHENHLELVRRMYSPGGIGGDLARASSLAEVYKLLLGWPMIGPFLAYQIAVDLNYTEYMNFSEDEFTVPGPGAVRGLQKVFSDFGGHRPESLILRMVERQEHEFERLGLDFDGLFGRRLHAVDCQGLFCETDKYSRVAFPELKSNRQRIKQTHSPNPTALGLFYPPKWGINDRLPDGASARTYELAAAQMSFDNDAWREQVPAAAVS